MYSSVLWSLWWWTVCVNRTRLSDAHIASKTRFLGVSVRCFQKRLSFELVNWVKQITLPGMSGHHPISWVLNRTGGRRKSEFNLSPSELGHPPSALRHQNSWFSGLWTWTGTSTIPSAASLSGFTAVLRIQIWGPGIISETKVLTQEETKILHVNQVPIILIIVIDIRKNFWELSSIDFQQGTKAIHWGKNNLFNRWC